MFSAGADPPIGLLPVHNGIDIFLCPGDHVLIVQKIRQGNKTVQPVGHPLPAFTAASDPCAVPNVGPDLAQIAAEAFGLQFKLPVKSSAGPDFIGRIKMPLLHGTHSLGFSIS